MSFLSPLFLAGLALLAAPWLIHRIRRPEREVVRFPSLMFVPDIKKEVIERRRIQHLLLMLLRMLVLLILVFSFSRPYFSRTLAPVPLPAAGLERHLILIDISGSMILGRSFDRAVKRAQSLLDELPNKAAIGLVAFDRNSNLLVPLTPEGAPLVREALASLRPGQSGTDLTSALAFAEGLLANPEASLDQPGHISQYIHLISDFQRSAVPETDETWRLSSQIHFRPYPINPDPKDLFAITDLAVRALDDATIAVAAKVRNLSDLDMEHLEVSLFIEDQPRESRKLSVQAGNATLVNFMLKTRGDFSGRVQVGTENDGDNQRYFVWRPPHRQKLLMVSDPSPASQYPAPWLMGLAIGDQWDRSTCSPDQLQTCLGAINPDLVIFCGLKKPGPNLGRDLNQYLAEGGKALVALDTNLELDALNSYLLAPFGLKSSGPQWPDVAADRFQVLSRVQLNSPIFQPFQGSRFNDFSLLHFNNFFKMSETGEARSIAWFNREQKDLPAILTLGVGEGRLVLWTFDLDLSQTNLAKSIKFVPLLQETLNWLVGPLDQIRNFVPGQTYDLARWQELGDITTPDGLNRGHSGSLVLTEAGLIRAGGLAVDAVNPIAEESLLQTYSEKEFALKFTAGNHLIAGQTIRNLAEGDVLKVEFGSYFLPVLFLFLLLETLLALKLSPRPRSAGEKMNEPQSKMDVHVRFRVEAVRDSLIRRRRWRCLRRFALGLLVLLPGFLIFWLVFKPYGSVATLAQLLFWPAVAGLVWYFLWEPLRKPVTNADAALLIDRLHPELQDRTTVLVALDENGQKSGWMEGEFVVEARKKIVGSRFGQNWDLVPFGESPGRILVLLFISLVILAWFPFVWQPFYGESWGLGHRFKVEPGNLKVQVGADQIILVKGGDAGDAAQILWRVSGQAWQEAGMAIGDSHDIRFYRFANIRQDLQYKIHVGSWESPRFELTTWLSAEVTGIDLTYHYPEYLALPPREVSEAGQITALEGSNIQLKIHVNKPLKQAEMVFDSGRRIRFSQSEPLVWTGTFIADRDDVYHLELLDRDGQAGLFQPGYEIAVSRDREPVIQMTFPYNDLQVSPMDEVPFTFSITDDFGLTAYGLRYQVEGRDPVMIELEKDLEKNLNVQVEHMLFLENLDLEPGDLINWTIWAKDQKPDRPEYEILGPPYFLEIRPFRRFFRESISDQAAAMQQPGQGDLVTQQKEVVIAIWNLRRVSGQLEAGPLEEKNGSILARESAIVQQVGQTMDQSQEEVVKLLNALNETVDQLKKTSLPQPQGSLSRAAVSAQTAYRLLLKLEPEESRIQRSSDQSGGQAASMREAGGTRDLEMDRNRNYYENENLTQNRQESLKEALNKLDELTRRQQLINEEIAGLISELQKKDDPETRRRLERLQDEIRKNIEKLDQMQRDVNQMEPREGGQTQNQMDQARQQMKQSLEELSQDRLQEARAAGNKAMDDLQKLEQDLKQQASGSASERMESLRDSLSQMEKNQQEIGEKVRQLQGQKGRPSLQTDAGSDQTRTQLLEQKEQLQQQFRNMIEEASQLEEFSRSSQELLARELGDWLRKTSREGLDEEIEETKELAGYGLWQELEDRERLIQQKLAEASRNFSKVEARLVKNQTDAQAMALTEITDLLQSLPQQSLSAWELKQWTERGYKDWLDGVENASSLLGGEAPLSRDLNRIRREIEKIRQEYRQQGTYPDKDLIIKAVLNPLEITAQQLEQELLAQRRQKEFILRDDGSVPDQYRKTVSEYFRLLSESEDKRK